jgi:hypothetical protein
MVLLHSDTKLDTWLLDPKLRRSGQLPVYFYNTNKALTSVRAMLALAPLCMAFGPSTNKCSTTPVSFLSLCMGAGYGLMKGQLWKAPLIHSAKCRGMRASGLLVPSKPALVGLPKHLQACPLWHLLGEQAQIYLFVGGSWMIKCPARCDKS